MMMYLEHDALWLEPASVVHVLYVHTCNDRYLDNAPMAVHEFHRITLYYWDGGEK